MTDIDTVPCPACEGLGWHCLTGDECPCCDEGRVSEADYDAIRAALRYTRELAEDYRQPPTKKRTWEQEFKRALEVERQTAMWRALSKPVTP